MREHLITTEIYGKLEIENLCVIENIKCKYTEDFYSNKNMKGEFESNGFSAEVLNEILGSKFKFNDKDGRLIKGRFIGKSINTNYNTRKDILKFQIEEFNQDLVLSDEKIVIMKISFRIPYISMLSRKLGRSNGFYSKNLVEFISQPLKVKISGYNVVFKEIISYLKHIDPDFIFNKVIYPEIKVRVNNQEEIKNLIKRFEDIMDNFMVLLSFLLFHRANYFGYDITFLDSNEKLVETYYCKFPNTNIGQDYIHNFNSSIHYFKSFFNKKNLEKLTNKFILKDRRLKGKLKKVLYQFITVGEIKIFQPQFISAYFVLEAISKLIVNPPQNKNIHPEKLIANAMSKASIRNDEINFKASQSRGLNWLITEYRNDITHFNYSEFDSQEVYDEFPKMMRLCRRLILYYIEPSLEKFPFPNYLAE